MSFNIRRMESEAAFTLLAHKWMVVLGMVALCIDSYKAMRVYQCLLNDVIFFRANESI